MNLHDLAVGIVSIVNPPITGTMRIANGYTTAPNGKRSPTYEDTVGVPFQVQALTAPELKQLDSLNIVGILQAVHFSGFLEAIDRDTEKGGDLIVFDGTDDVPSVIRGTTWQVVKVLERWPASGWCRAAIQKQLS